MPIHWPHKLKFHHKIIEMKLFQPFFPSCERLNKYSVRVKQFNPSVMFGTQNGGEGKMGVKTFIMESLPPPPPPSPLCLRDEDYAFRLLAFSPTSSGIKDITIKDTSRNISGGRLSLACFLRRKWPNSMFFFQKNAYWKALMVISTGANWVGGRWIARERWTETMVDRPLSETGGEVLTYNSTKRQWMEETLSCGLEGWRRDGGG